MNADSFAPIAAQLLKATLIAALACCVNLGTRTAIAQPNNQFAPSSILETITPSQNDSTYTPDPYYTPDITPDTSSVAQNSAITWTPPGTSVAVENRFTTPSPKQNKVRSLMEAETWQPPKTPVAPGYEPSKLTHSPIPWLHQPDPKSAQPATVSLTEAARNQLQKANAGNSIIRPNTISPVASGTNKMISNSFAGSGSNSKATTGSLQPAPSQTLAPTLTIPRPTVKPIAADIEKPVIPKPKSQSDFAAKPLKSGSQSKTVNADAVLPAKRKLSFDSDEPVASKPKPASKGSATKPATDGSATKHASKGSATKSGSATKPQPAKGPSTAFAEALNDAVVNGSARPSGAETFERSQLLALVGGEPIFVGDTLLEVNQLIEKHMSGAPDDKKAEARRGLIKQILPKLVNEKLLYVGALQDLPEEADIEAIVQSAAKEFDEKALPDLLKRVKVKDAADYDALLRGMGSSLRKRRDAWAREQLTRFFVSEKLKFNREITHQQLLDEYRANLEEYKIAEKSKWEQIMVRFDRFSSRDEAYEAIVELGNRIVHGASLSAVAKKNSHGFQADKGGQHDWTGRDALVLKEIDEAIFDLPVGKLSDVIETRDGLHIVRVIDRQEAAVKPFTEAQVDIKKRLKDKMRSEAFEKHLAELKERIPVEYFPFETNDVAATKSDFLLK